MVGRWDSRSRVVERPSRQCRCKSGAARGVRSPVGALSVADVRREIGRREFLGMVGAVGTLAACSSSKAPRAHPRRPSTHQAKGALPRPADAPFDTVVVLMMENRSFD